MNLKLEVNEEFQKQNTEFKVVGHSFSITPAVEEDYFLFRVKLLKDQALIAFPKFFTIGIGFAQEEDWNTNLPYSCETEKIYNYIKRNKKYKNITKKDCIEAIKLLQKASEKALEKKED